MNVEAIILAGGRSSRMGQDKASLQIQGETQLARLVRIFESMEVRITTLGGPPLEQTHHIPDVERFGGALAALRQFIPTHEFVFIASCDLYRFDGRLVEALMVRIGSADAAIPIHRGRRQPLCALYQASSWRVLQEHPEWTRMLDWVDAIRVVDVSAKDLNLSGIGESAILGANNPSELKQLLDS